MRLQTSQLYAFLTGKNYIKIAVAIFFATAFFSNGYHHPDEHFQILEFAGWQMRKTPAADLPWEFGAQIRPAFQPLLAVFLIRFFEVFGIFNPFFQVFLMRLLTGFSALWVYYHFTKNYENKYISREFILLSIVFLWFVPYQFVRFSSENLSAILFWGGTAGVLSLISKKITTNGAKVGIGFVLALSFYCRFQMGFALAGLGLWLLFYKKFKLPDWVWFFLGGILGLGLGLVADRFFYGNWVITPYQYFYANITENKAANWGIMPWWYYLTSFVLDGIPPISIILMVLAGLGGYRMRREPVVWIFALFIVAHSAVGHKELRFLFPMTFGLLVMASAGWEQWRRYIALKSGWRILGIIAIVVNGILLIYRTTVPAHSFAKTQAVLYDLSKDKTEVTLFCIGKDPYKLVGLNSHFYKPNNLVLFSPERTDSLTCNLVLSGNIYCTNKPIEQDIHLVEPIFQSIPAWLEPFNINNWQDRVDRVWIYRRL